MFGEPVVTPSNFMTVDGNTLLRVEAASANWYKVEMPNGQQGYIQSAATSSINTPIKKLTVTADQPLLDAPDYNAPRKTNISAGKSVSILASFRDFHYVKVSDDTEGWISKK
jgi:SH3-like domain-containing protein